MNKEIITIGYEIPGFGSSEAGFGSDQSLLDADIVVISPEEITPSYRDWVSFNAGGGCHSVEASQNFERDLGRLQKELSDFLSSGRTAFVFLSKVNSPQLSSGTTSPRKGERRYQTYNRSNYDFLPIEIGSKTSSSGTHINFVGSEVFREFSNSFAESLKYRMYIENIEHGAPIFVGKLKDKILGAHFRVGAGNLVLLPYLDYDFDEFTTEVGEEGNVTTVWNEQGLSFGKQLVGILHKIDKELSSGSTFEKPPKWSENTKFELEAEKAAKEKLKKLIFEKEKISKKLLAQEEVLNDERVLKALLYGQGISLEQAVTRALQILGYSAEGYDDGELELDQVIVSPEGLRFIGECEGKDSKDINITKFRQLVESMNADFDRDEVDEKAFGLLFGNPQRITEPAKRDSDFTAKCKSGAKREQIGLINTVDLFFAARHAAESNDDSFKKACRDAIRDGLGSVIEFPKPD